MNRIERSTETSPKMNDLEGRKLKLMQMRKQHQRFQISENEKSKEALKSIYIHSARHKIALA